MNSLQYICTTHRTKDEAKHDKKLVNSLHNIYYKSNCSFDEVCYLHDSGCIIARIGNTTDFLIIDIDNTSVNINEVYDKFKDNNDIHIAYSVSNNPLRYHILVNLHRTITVGEYKSAVIEEFAKIKSIVCHNCNFMEMDSKSSDFYHCFFGTSVDSRIDVILPDSVRLYNWTKKGNEPNVYLTDKVAKKYPSLNSADYCCKHGILTIKEDTRYDIYLPSMTNGRLKKIKEGYRYNWTLLMGAKLLMRIFYLNHILHEEWNKLDYLNTLEMIVRINVVRSDEFCNSSDFKSLMRFFDNKFSIVCRLPYEEIKKELEPYFISNGKFVCSQRQYKSKKYIPTVMSQIVQEHLMDNTTVVFTDKEELQAICKEYMINYYRFVKFVKELNYSLVFECVNSHNKGSCLNNYEVVNNTVNIPRDKVTNAIRSYCARNKITIVRV